jgi:hypothetical protein
LKFPLQDALSYLTKSVVDHIERVGNIMQVLALSSSPEDENLTPRSFQSSFFFLNLSKMLESQNDYDSNILGKGKARMNNTNEELDFSSSTHLFLYYPLQFVEGTSKFIEEETSSPQLNV